MTQEKFTDKELKKIFNTKGINSQAYWNFQRLSLQDKDRLFKLIAEGKIKEGVKDSNKPHILIGEGC